MPDAPELSIVIPTLGRAALLRRVLGCLDRQSAGDGAFEVIVAADAQEASSGSIDDALIGHSFSGRRVVGARPGASAARNAGWRAAATPLVLFVDDDVLPEPELVAEHLDWHRRSPDDTVGVLGHVDWADELRVTPFMRWLEDGIQFDYGGIQGVDAGWGRFYTANASVKRAMLDRVGGFEEEALPFGYEDLDLGLRMHRLGFRLLYNRAARAQHLHPMDLEFWKHRVARIAVSERSFVARHPSVRPYFHDLFAEALAQPRARARGERLARFVPRWVPLLGRRVWESADVTYRQALAEPFMEAWRAASEPSSGPK